MSLPLQIAASQGARRRGRGMLGQRLFFQAQEDAARLQTQADTGLDPNGALFRKLSDDRGRFPLPGDWTVGLGAKVQRDEQAQRDVSIARTFLGEDGRRRVAPTVTERRQATPGTLEFVMKSVDRGLKLTPEDRSLVDSVLTARGLVFDEQAPIQMPGFNDRNVKPTERAGSLIRVRNDDVVDVLNQIRKPEGRAALMAEVAGFRQLRAQASAAAHVDNTIFDQAPFTYESLMRSRQHGTSAVELRDGKLMPMAEALQVANELQWPVQPVKQLSEDDQAAELMPTHKGLGYDQIRYGDGKDIRQWLDGRFQRSMKEGGKAVGQALEQMFPSFSGLAIDLDADKVANVGKLAMTTLPGFVTGAFLNSPVGKDVVKGMNGQKVSDLVGGLIGGLPAGAVQAVPMAMSNLDYAADPKNPAFDRAMALAEGLGNLDFASGNQLGALGMKAGSRVTQAVRAALARDMQIPVELIDEAFARAAQQAREARGTGPAGNAPIDQPNKSLSSVGDGTPLPAGEQVVKEHDAAAALLPPDHPLLDPFSEDPRAPEVQAGLRRALGLEPDEPYHADHEQFHRALEDGDLAAENRLDAAKEYRSQFKRTGGRYEKTDYPTYARKGEEGMRAWRKGADGRWLPDMRKAHNFSTLEGFDDPAIVEGILGKVAELEDGQTLYLDQKTSDSLIIPRRQRQGKRWTLAAGLDKPPAGARRISEIPYAEHADPLQYLQENGVLPSDISVPTRAIRLYLKDLEGHIDLLADPAAAARRRAEKLGLTEEEYAAALEHYDQLAERGGETEGRGSNADVGANGQGEQGNVGRTEVRGLDDFRTGLVDQWRLPAEQADAVTTLLKARAGAKARIYGGSIDDHVAQMIGEIRSGDQQGLIDRHGVDPQGKKGAHELLADGRSVIHALENPDISTAVHELWHVFQKDLDAADSAIVSQQHALYQQQHQQQFGSLDNALSDREYFARQGERYLRDGKTSLAPMRAIFEKFKSWMSEVYAQLKGSPIDAKVSKEMRQLFDRMLDAEGKPSRNGNRVVSNGKIYDLNPEQITAHENLTNEYIGRRDLLEEELKGARTEDERNDIEYELRRLELNYKADQAKILAGVDFQEAPMPEPIGQGEHGPIYEGLKDADAENVLRQVRSGEVLGALHHPAVGDIDLIWGEAETRKPTGGLVPGYGLAKIESKHPEVLGKLQPLLNDMREVSRTENTVQLQSATHTAAVKLQYRGREKTWLLTQFEDLKRSGGSPDSNLGARPSGSQTDGTLVAADESTTPLPPDVANVPERGPADQLSGSGDSSAPDRTSGSELATGPGPADHLPASREPAPMETGPEGTVPKPDFQEDPFYHKSERVLEEKMRGPMLSQDVSRLLQNSGVKADELKWTGLDQWLRDRMGVKVTPDEVRQYLEANKVQLREVVKSLQPVNWERVGDSWMYDGNRITRLSNGRYAVRTSSGMTDTFPTLEAAKANFGPAKGDTKYSSYQAPGGENYREVLLTVPDKGDSYQGPHWDEPNVVAHMRVSDRTIDGKRTLFLDEVQSDWHQAARQGKDVPDGPFRNSWHELTMRRAMRYAAENGYDAIAWTTGDAQALRYSQTLQEGVDMMRVAKRSEGQYEILARGKSGRDIVDDVVDDAQLREMLGGAMYKDAKAAFDAGKPDWSASGENLKIGGHGMREFYDGILPRFMSKEGKKWGAAVETRAMETPAGMVDVHAVDVTPEMRRSVIDEGQVLFQTADKPAGYVEPTPQQIRVAEQEQNPEWNQLKHKMMRPFLSMFGDPDARLRNLGTAGSTARKAGTELADGLRQVVQTSTAQTLELSRLLSNEIENQYGKLWVANGRAKEELRQLTQMIHDGQIEGLNDRQKAVHAKWIEIQSKLRPEAEAVGVWIDDHVRGDVWKKLKGEMVSFYGTDKFGTRREMTGKVMGGGDDLIHVKVFGRGGGVFTLEKWEPYSRRSLVQDNLFIPRVVKKEVNEAIQAIFNGDVTKKQRELADKIVAEVQAQLGTDDAESTIAMMRHVMDPARTSNTVVGKLARIEKPRLPFKLPTEMYEDGFYDLAQGHIAGTVKRIQAARMWGQDEGRVQELLKKVSEALGSQESEKMSEQIRYALGTHKSAEADAALKTVASVEGAWQSLTKLTGIGTTIRQLSQTASAYAVLGGKAWMQTLGTVAKDLANGRAEIAAIKDSGAVTNDIVQMMAMDDVPKMAQLLTEWGLTATLVKPADLILRYHAAITGRIAAEDALRGLKIVNGQIERTAKYRLLRNWFGYTDRDIIRMYGSGMAKQDLIAAYTGGVKTQNMSRNIDMPKWMHDSSAAKVLFRFQTFNYQQAKILGYAAREAAAGNIAPMARMIAGYAVAGYGTAELYKHAMSLLESKMTPEEAKRRGVEKVGLQPKESDFEDLAGELLKDAVKGGAMGLYGLPVEGVLKRAERDRDFTFGDLMQATGDEVRGLVSPPVLRDVGSLAKASAWAWKTQGGAPAWFDAYLRDAVVLYKRFAARGDDDVNGIKAMRAAARQALEERGVETTEIDNALDVLMPVPAPRGSTAEYVDYKAKTAERAQKLGDYDKARGQVLRKYFKGQVPKTFAADDKPEPAPIATARSATRLLRKRLRESD